MIRGAYRSQSGLSFPPNRPRFFFFSGWPGGGGSSSRFGPTGVQSIAQWGQV